MECNLASLFEGGGAAKAVTEGVSLDSGTLPQSPNGDSPLSEGAKAMTCETPRHGEGSYARGNSLIHNEVLYEK